MKDDCTCVLCTLRRKLEAEMVEKPESNIGEAQGRAVVSVQEDLNAAQVNLTLATSVDLLTRSLVRAESVNDQATVAGIRRALAQILPPAEEPVAATAPAEPANTMDVAPEGISAEVAALAKQLAKDLGIEVQVVRFPRG